ncbi:MAG: hypothetical protein K2L34_10215 [Muribaculaceae bacterium]|nr:hypothetical protein [Muribaculaceae bacterium]
MEEKMITEKEGIEIISQMIRRTQQRLQLGQGNQLLLWGYVCAFTAIVVGILVYLQIPWAGWMWFLIPVIGNPISWILRKRQERVSGFISYTDRLTGGLWTYIGCVGVVITVLCLIFFIYSGTAGSTIWNLMFLFGFIIGGLGVALQGIIFQENSLKIGGTVSIVAGYIVLGCLIFWQHNVHLVVLPLFLISVISMFIIPGYVINNKAKRETDL